MPTQHPEQSGSEEAQTLPPVHTRAVEPLQSGGENSNPGRETQNNVGTGSMSNLVLNWEYWSVEKLLSRNQCVGKEV